MDNLETTVPKTWCPGCPNFGVLAAVKQAVGSLEQEKFLKRKDLVAVTGIGCHGKIYDYLNLNGFYSLHGRSLSTMLGIKIGNPKLKVVGFMGDGDAYAEGMAHLIHTCRYNADLTAIIHNNQTFALTTGQETPTSDENEFRFNPLSLALEAGASFVARGYALDIPHLSDLIKKAVAHRGFSIIEVVQPCLVFQDNAEFFKEKITKVDQAKSKNEALEIIRSWDYSVSSKDKVPTGLFYQEKKPCFENQWTNLERKPLTQERLKSWFA